MRTAVHEEHIRKRLGPLSLGSGQPDSLLENGEEFFPRVFEAVRCAQLVVVHLTACGRSRCPSRRRGQPWIGADGVVDEHASRIDRLGRDALAAGQIAREDGSAQ
jgi:hypothetical protein